MSSFTSQLTNKANIIVAISHVLFSESLAIFKEWTRKPNIKHEIIFRSNKTDETLVWVKVDLRTPYISVFRNISWSLVYCLCIIACRGWIKHVKHDASIYGTGVRFFNMFSVHGVSEIFINSNKSFCLCDLR